MREEGKPVDVGVREGFTPSRLERRSRDLRAPMSELGRPVVLGVLGEDALVVGLMVVEAAAAPACNAPGFALIMEEVAGGPDKIAILGDEMLVVLKPTCEGFLLVQGFRLLLSLVLELPAEPELLELLEPMSKFSVLEGPPPWLSELAELLLLPFKIDLTWDSFERRVEVWNLERFLEAPDAIVEEPSEFVLRRRLLEYSGMGVLSEEPAMCASSSTMASELGETDAEDDDVPGSRDRMLFSKLLAREEP